jgi:DNA processing protein
MIIKEICKEDIEFPLLLKEINSCPKKIYAAGNIELLRQKCIAIVGCRDATDYGKIIARKLSIKLSKMGFVIVSGLALGIDTSAHLGTLESNGRTIAVLGSGINNIYPNSNIKLAREIITNGGLVISEYSNYEGPKASNFPKRNRIISGLSIATIVVEAKERSGALITSRFATDQGRDVYAVPGNIFSKQSVGTNELIKQGAIPINSIEKINFNYPF